MEAIEKSLHDGLDEKSSLDLMDHIETCKRCRRFRGYLEAVEQGFRNLPVDLSEISPMASRELPTVLQDEMAQAMKRNLSRWLFETVRCVMHRDKMVGDSFHDEIELFPLNSTLNRTSSLYASISKTNRLDNNERIFLSDGELFIEKMSPKKKPIEIKTAIGAIKICLALHKNADPYCYLDHLYVANNRLLD
ncbi:MAG: hypothetical protein KJ645_10815, partial [Planctomycetes bacterium]|nr:hypothetical protein [Planctomycetota bacterium]